MGIFNDNRSLAITAAAASCGVIAGLYCYKRYSDNQKYWNSEFVHAGQVHQLHIFPIKSCKPIETDWLECTNVGAKYGENKDRHFLIVDAKLDHMFLTARQYPKLVLLGCKVENGVLTVTNTEGESVYVDLNETVKRNDVRNGILHEKLRQEGYDCGDEIGHFLNAFLDTHDKRDLRLIYYVQGLNTGRNYTTDQTFWLNPVPVVSDTPAYQDLASYMLCTQASVDELNSRLENTDDGTVRVDVRNFRPNINVSGTVPFDEDRWLHVRIGEVEFTCFKPCTRCVLTTVDPDKGTFNNNMQPLKLLREYRSAPEGRLLELYKKSPVFGVNMMTTKPGVIKKGDQVYVRYKPTPF